MKDIEESNDTEATRLWQVIRAKKCLNVKDSALKNFSTESDEAYSSDIAVSDIIRFGRVNFKVSTLISRDDLLDPSCQGGYYLYEKNRAPEFEYLEEEPEIKDQDEDAF